MCSFEDPFAHRDRKNKPYDRLNLLENSPPGGVGHALAGHFPDHTYNDMDYEADYDSDGNRIEVEAPWKYNELRTLEMEKEVFELIKRDFAIEIAENASAQNVTWRDLVGGGTSATGVSGTAGYVPSKDANEVLQLFNAERDDQKKIKLLNDWLDGHGFAKIPDYSVQVGSARRTNILGGFDPENPNFDGVLLPALWQP